MATKKGDQKKAKGTDDGVVVVRHNKTTTTTTTTKNQRGLSTRSPPPRRRRRNDDNEELQPQEEISSSSSSLHHKEKDGSTTTTTRTTRRSSPRTATNRSTSTTTARPIIMAPVGTPSSPPPRCRLRRRTERGPDAALQSLAECIVVERANILIISGAGLSVPSGVRPFRTGQEAIWHHVIWTTATRAAFRKNPRAWYQDFWNVYFDDDDGNHGNNNGDNTSTKKYRPNNGHLALDRLLEQYGNVRQVTQNIDGLQQQQSLSRSRDDDDDDPQPKEEDNDDDDDHSASRRLIEGHGRLGLYKCCPDFDSSDDDDDDDDESLDDDDDADEDNNDDKNNNNQNRCRRRPARLGHRKKARRAQLTRGLRCPYQYDQTIGASQLHSTEDYPKCPHCGNPAMPQALLFDEGYHSHSYYQFTRIEDWLAKANVLVFVGTSFAAVRLTQVALDVARQRHLRVYNINVADMLSPTLRLHDVSNIVGCADTLLPRLLSLCDHLQQQQQQQQPDDPPPPRQRQRTAAVSACSKAATTTTS